MVNEECRRKDHFVDITEMVGNVSGNVAANESIRTGKPVRIDSLFPVEMLEG